METSAATNTDKDPKFTVEFLAQRLGPLLAIKNDVSPALARTYLAKACGANPSQERLLESIATAQALHDVEREIAAACAGGSQDGGDATCDEVDGQDEDDHVGGDVIIEVSNRETRFGEDFVTNLYCSSMEEAKRLAEEHSVQVDRLLRPVRTQPERYIVGCWDALCQYYMVAVKDQCGRTCIRTWVKRHTCVAKTERGKDPRNRFKFLVKKLQPLVAKNPAVDKRKAAKYLLKRHGTKPRGDQVHRALIACKKLLQDPTGNGASGAGGGQGEESDDEGEISDDPDNSDTEIAREGNRRAGRPSNSNEETVPVSENISEAVPPSEGNGEIPPMSPMKDTPFPSLADVKKAAEDLSKQVNRPLMVSANLKRRFVAGCFDDTCPFFLHAAANEDGSAVVKEWQRNHTCNFMPKKGTKGVQGSEKFVGQKLLLPLLKANPSTAVPEAQTYIRNEFGLHLDDWSIRFAIAECFALPEMRDPLLARKADRETLLREGIQGDVQALLEGSGRPAAAGGDGEGAPPSVAGALGPPFAQGLRKKAAPKKKQRKSAEKLPGNGPAAQGRRHDGRTEEERDEDEVHRRKRRRLQAQAAASYAQALEAGQDGGGQGEDGAPVQLPRARPIQEDLPSTAAEIRRVGRWRRVEEGSNPKDPEEEERIRKLMETDTTAVENVGDTDSQLALEGTVAEAEQPECSYEISGVGGVLPEFFLTEGQVEIVEAPVEKDLVFSSMKVLKAVVKDHSGRVGRAFKVLKALRNKWTLGCHDANCPYYLHAAGALDGPVRVLVWNKVHTCEPDPQRPQNMTSWLRQKLLPLVHRFPDISYTAVRAHLKKQYNVDPDPSTLYRVMGMCKSHRVFPRRGGGYAMGGGEGGRSDESSGGDSSSDSDGDEADSAVVPWKQVVYRSMADVKRKAREDAVASGRNFKVVKSTYSEWSISCVHQDCPYLLYAKTNKMRGTFLKQWHKEHTCERPPDDKHPCNDTRWLREKLQPLFSSTPDVSSRQALDFVKQHFDMEPTLDNVGRTLRLLNGIEQEKKRRPRDRPRRRQRVQAAQPQAQETDMRPMAAGAEQEGRAAEDGSCEGDEDIQLDMNGDIVAAVEAQQNKAAEERRNSLRSGSGPSGREEQWIPRHAMHPRESSIFQQFMDQEPILEGAPATPQVHEYTDQQQVQYSAAYGLEQGVRDATWGPLSEQDNPSQPLLHAEVSRQLGMQSVVDERALVWPPPRQGGGGGGKKRSAQTRQRERQQHQQLQQHDQQQQQQQRSTEEARLMANMQLVQRLLPEAYEQQRQGSMTLGEFFAGQGTSLQPMVTGDPISQHLSQRTGSESLEVLRSSSPAVRGFPSGAATTQSTAHHSRRQQEHRDAGSEVSGINPLQPRMAVDDYGQQQLYGQQAQQGLGQQQDQLMDLNQQWQQPHAEQHHHSNATRLQELQQLMARPQQGLLASAGQQSGGLGISVAQQGRGHRGASVSLSGQGGVQGEMVGTPTATQVGAVGPGVQDPLVQELVRMNMLMAQCLLKGDSQDPQLRQQMSSFLSMAQQGRFG